MSKKPDQRDSAAERAIALYRMGRYNDVREELAKLTAFDLHSLLWDTSGDASLSDLYALVAEASEALRGAPEASDSKPL